MAWHYIYFNMDEELAKIEQETREMKIGLWSKSNPVAPWDFRRKL